MQPLACLDVHYEGESARAACLLFRQWEDELELSQHVTTRNGVAEYETGEFYKRELPCLLDVLQSLCVLPRAVIIDGYVWLEDNKPGLGARLYAALQGATPVIGVAKTFLRSPRAVKIERRDSRNALYVTAAGVSAREAAKWVGGMHGPYRLPTLLKRVDQLSRGVLV